MNNPVTRLRSLAIGPPNKSLTIGRPSDKSSSAELTPRLLAYLESAVPDDIARDAFAELVYGGRVDLALALLISATQRGNQGAAPPPPPAAQNEPASSSSNSQQENRMITNAVDNWSSRALQAETELKIERAHRTGVLHELRSEVQSLVQLQPTNAARPFILPTQVLSFYESIQNPVERSWFYHRFEEEIKVAIRAKEWSEIQSHGDKIEASRKPAPDSFCAQHEAITDPVQRREFYEKNKEAIHQELDARRSETLRLQAEQRLNGEPAQTL